MKALYIIAIIVTVIFGITVSYYANEYDSVYNYSSYDIDYNYEYGFYNSIFDEYYKKTEITFEGALVSLLFISFYVLTFIFSLIKIKRTTAKVISIIGLSLSGLLFLFTFLPLSSPGSISFNEFGGLLFVFALVMLAFCIVNLIQSIRNENSVKINLKTVDDVS